MGGRERKKESDSIGRERERGGGGRRRRKRESTNFQARKHTTQHTATAGLPSFRQQDRAGLSPPLLDSSANAGGRSEIC